MTQSRRWLLILFTLIATIMVGWSAQPDGPTLNPGDKIRVTCVEEPSMDREYEINSDGLVILPYLGAIEVKGKTEAEAAAAIAGALIDQQVLRRATVSVQLSRPVTPVKMVVSVTGAVNQPGELPFAEGLRLSDALRFAGLQDDADISRILITPKAGEPRTISFVNDPAAEAARNPFLVAGDAITVPALPKSQDVFVLGGVQRPGRITYAPDLTLAEALRLAGGFDDLGDPRRVRIERPGTAPTIYDSTTLVDPIPLQPGDRIVVELQPNRRFVMVLGYVTRPGQVEFRDGMTLMEAIAAAGGPNERIPVDRVAVYGPEDEALKKPVFYSLDRINRGFVGDVALAPGSKVEALRAGQRNPNGLKAFLVAVAAIFFLGR